MIHVKSLPVRKHGLNDNFRIPFLLSLIHFRFQARNDAIELIKIGE